MKAAVHHMKCITEMYACQIAEISGLSANGSLLEYG